MQQDNLKIIVFQTQECVYVCVLCVYVPVYVCVHVNLCITVELSCCYRHIYNFPIHESQVKIQI